MRPEPIRLRLPAERESITHHFVITDAEGEAHDGYIHVGLYANNTPGELFVRMAKEGSTISGFVDGVAVAVSLGLQYGVPMQAFVNKYKHMRFEPLGWTPNKDISRTSSVLDYVFRWLEYKFCQIDQPVNQKS